MVNRAPVHVTILIAITGIVMFTNLGTARLWDRDEPRNAGCALEMMHRGDLVVPMFNDELRHQKPVLLYWLMISAYQVFGVTEFAARFWSAVLAIGTVLATYAIGRRLLNPRAALLGAIGLLTSMMFVVAGRAATPDSLLIFCSTMALLFYVLGTFASYQLIDVGPVLRQEGNWFPQRYRYVLAMYGMMGLGVLAKGPVGFVLPCAIIGMFMLLMRLPAADGDQWNRRAWLARFGAAVGRPFAPGHFLATVWAMRPLSLIAIILLVAGPWYLLVGVRTAGDWPRIFFLSENLARATSSFESHGGGLWFYPLSIVLGFFPASIFLGPMILGIDRQVIQRRHQWSPGYTLLICWVCVQVGLFSLAKTKLPSYITPCYPALALLTGGFLAQLMQRRVDEIRKFDRWPATGLLLSGIGVTAALIFAGQRYLDGNREPALFGLLLTLGAGGMLWFARTGRMRPAIHVFCLTAVLFAIGLFGFGTVAVDRHQQNDRILARIAASDSRAPVAAFECLESSWVFYGRRPIYELTETRRSGAWQDARVNAWQKKDWPSPEQFVTAHPSAMIITTSESLAKLQGRLPAHYQVLQRASYFLRDKDLVLVGPVTPSAPADSPRTADAESMQHDLPAARLDR